ncbi:MAG: hypothetical protein WCR06_05005 [bacterium]
MKQIVRFKARGWQVGHRRPSTVIVAVVVHRYGKESVDDYGDDYGRR